MKRIFSLILVLIAMHAAFAQVVAVDLTRKNLYVKEKGTGNGSTWKDAMGPQTFAYYLPQAKDGTTFHVAEGTYYPMYDSYLRLSTGVSATSAVFTVNSDITIKGGYSADPKEGEVSVPSMYKATFSGDFGNDDEYKVSTNASRNYYLDIQNVNDNCSNLFLVRPSVKGNWTTNLSTPDLDETDTKNYLKLEGVSLKGARGWIILSAGLNLEISLSYSTVENCSGIDMLTDHPTFIADNCKFTNIASNIWFETPKEVSISNSVFDGCGTLKVVNLEEKYTSKINLDNNRFKRSVYSNGTIEISGLCDLVAKNTVFSNMKMTSSLVWGGETNMEFYDCDVQSVRADYELFYTNKSAKFENCSFTSSESRFFLDFGASKTESFSINKCLFDSNEFSFSFFQPGMKASITNSTFLYNSCESYFMWNHSDSFTFANNSVLANSSKSQGFYIVNPNFYNNTILGNEFDGGLVEFGRYFDDEPSSTNMYGNIVLGNGTKLSAIGYENLPVIKSDKKNIYYNLLPIVRSDYQEEGKADNTTWTPDNKTNIFVRPFDLGANESSLCKTCASAYPEFEEKVLSQLFNGRYDDRDHYFDPTLDSDEETPVIKLKTTRLGDGTDLLFPLKNTTVTKDQLGEDRTSYTSMGAIEKSCVSETTFVTETITVGSSFEGKKYSKIGSYDNINVTKKNIYGCDSVVNYTLKVIPNSTIKEFYVKTKASGTGDGSSWDNAMSPKDFAFVFANSVVEGITYYVAAGKYYPVYNFSGKEVNDRNAFWTTNRGANIYGGYDSLATGNAKTTKSNPSKYRTIFSGDFENDDKISPSDECRYYIDNLRDNVNSNLMYFKTSSDMHISGVEFTGMTYSRGTAPTMVGISGEKSCNVIIDYCKFYVADRGLSVYDVNNLVVDNCEFEYLLNAASHSNCSTRLSNSTFFHTGGISYSGNTQNIDVFNCTFVDNGTNLNFSNDNFADVVDYSANIDNNTFISCTDGSSYISFYDNVKASFVGNLFVGTKISTYTDGNGPQTQVFNNNLFASSSLNLPTSAVEKNNIKLKSAEDFYKEKVLDGKYTASTGVFVPNLITNGGYTRTVALLDDKLSTGEELRLPYDANLETDQRGVSRLPMTCMGAYELRCRKDTTFVTDTIMVGSSLHDSIFTEIGRHDSVIFKLVGKYDCDSIVCYTIFVTPNLEAQNYYVKTERVGKGDGSDWGNAMSGEDFEWVMPFVKKGSSFYFAAGTYKPVGYYERNYTIFTPINIYGGYPKDAKEGDVSDPLLNKTIFSGDVNDDDEYKYDNTTNTVELLNTEDNLYKVFRSYSFTSPSVVSFSGFTIKGATETGFSLCSNYESELYLDKCCFEGNMKGLDHWPGNTFSKDCKFSYNNTAFESYNYLSTYQRFESCSFYRNTNGIRIGYSIDVINSTFVNCDIAVYLYFRSREDDCHFYNNTIIDVNNVLQSYYNNFNTGVDLLGNVFCIGNIVEAKSLIEATGFYKENVLYPKVSLGQNLLTSKSVDLYEEYDLNKEILKNNIIVEDSKSIYSILEGTEENDNLFNAKMEPNGGYSLSVALKSDVLSDGTSIRFPRLENVLTDQRGVERLDSTCMGAYEMRCGDDTTFVVDTIVVGTEFMDSVYTEIGRHDSIIKVYKSKLDCDSVVNYTLFVTPDPNVLNYYVKTKRTGKGDGSDWDNAMNGDDFAAALPLAPKGAVFHLAEGIYEPLYDYTGRRSDYPMYYLNNDVSLLGGYPSDAKTGASPDPARNKTEFKIKNETSFLFGSYDSKKIQFLFDGFHVNNLDEIVIQLYSADVVIKNSSFDGNKKAVLQINTTGSLSIINSEILNSNNTYYPINLSGATSIDLRKVKFIDNNTYPILSYGNGYKVSLDSVEASGNKQAFEFYGSNSLSVKNSSFEDNTDGAYLLYTDGDIEISNSIFRNNIGYGDLIYSYRAKTSNIDKCEFAGNDATYILYLVDADSCVCECKESKFLSNKTTNVIYTNTISLENCEFDSNKCTEYLSTTSKINPCLIRALGPNVNIESTKFSNNECGDYLLDATQLKNFEIQNSWFKQNLSNSSLVSVMQDPTDKTLINNLEGNTFEGNSCSILIYDFNNHGCTMYVKNNTFVSNTCESVLLEWYYSNVKFNNNSVLGNVINNGNVFNSQYKLESLEGNIIWGNKVGDVLRLSDPNNPTHNIMSLYVLYDFDLKAYIAYMPDESNVVSENNLDKYLEYVKNPGSDDISNVKDRSEELSTLFTGEYDKTTGIFTPELTVDANSFPPVVALRNDKLLDGTSIRFPRLEDIVTDQLGESRLDLTCMGAYELFSGRDTVYVYTNDTVCLGSNYERNGWSLLTEDLAEGEYKYGRFLKGKVATDTIDTLVLHVNPYNKIMVEPTVTPTLCHGDGYGEVTFNPYSFVSGSAIVNVMNDNGDILFSDAQNFNSVYNNNKLEIGKYGISIKSQTQCVLDTLINIEVIDRESLKSVGDLEDMITECANEPTSEVKISLTGFHPSMKFYHNGEEITSQTENDKLVYSADAAVTAKASLSMSKIAVGKHSITAVDACENTFELGEFNVIVPENQIVDMKLVDYTKKPLSCGLDSGYAQFNITSGAASTFYLKSDLGYSYTLSLQAEDTLLKLSDLTKGNYQALLKKNSATCSDTSFAEFPITSPEPLSLSLTSNGAACAEGSVMADAAGGTGVLTYHWTDPTGKKFDTESSKLEEASAGTYKCVVEDATHCFSHTDSIDILPNVENLFELHVSEPVIKNITCFDLENGTIEIPFSTENAQQAVALVVTNTKTGKETKTSGTYASTNGLLAIRTLAKGSYSYEVYYGTESCRLDTNSVKGTFKISAKETPFEMLPLSVYKEQTCLNPSNGSIVDTVIGWENDYKAYLITEQGNKYNVKPTVENGVTKLYADLLSGGFYYYKVEDACGSVMKTEAVNLTKYSPLSITVTSFTDSVTCAKSKDAEIKFFITGGIGTNHMAYVDDKSYTKKGSIVSKDNGQGYHDVYYKSTIAGCKDSVGERIRIAGPDTLEIKYTLTGNCPGSALIPEVSGESGEYTYLWSDGSREIDGTEEFPFDDMEAGETYSLTVSDVKCDYGYTKSFRIPTADELPTISQVVVAESEKCHNGNNGKIIVKPTLSKKMDFALTATIFYHKVGSKDSIPYSCVLDPDAVYTTPENLEPGDYRVTTRLGTMDCDMGVNPATVVKTVDPLPSLEIKSKIAVTDQTCKTPNGTATFTVEGWTYTHTAKLYYYPLGISLVYLNKDITPTSVDENYVATFELNSLSFGTYKIMVRDICDNKDESDKFKIVYKPTKIKNITTKKSTCINEPNGVMEFDIEGWTSLHNCDLVKDDNAQAGYFDDVQPVSYDETTKKAHFSVNTLSAGNWRIWVKNECDESWCLDTFNVVEGITEYHIGHINKLTTTMLDCPYSEDGEIGIAYYGGYNPGELVATVNSTVPVYKQTGYETKIVERFETIKVGKMVYDSTKCDTTYITDVVGAAKDTVVTMYVNCPPMVDPETGEFVVDSIEYNVTVYDTIPVPVYGYVDSTTYDTMNARNPIPYKRLPLEYRVVSKFLDINNNIFTDLGVGTYVFRYKSAVEGCSDMATDTVRIRRPDPVHIVKQVLDISCATSTDGQVSIKPLRGQTTLPEKPQYVVSHDTSGLYQFNNVYSFSTDSISNQYGTVPSNNHKLLIDADGNPVKHRIDVVNDQSDFKSITWSYAKKKTDSWKKLDLTMPTSVDSTEQFFFNSNKDTIKSAVYSNFHLDNFWIDYNGVYQYSDVQSIANLSSGYYAVEVTDSKSCVYHDTFRISLPETALQIVSIDFDEEKAKCDPKQRQIHVDVKGGWGKYVYSFTDMSSLNKPMSTKSNGYRGGEAAHYDSVAVTGWCDSKFLEPGEYVINVMDEKGCVVSSEKKYKVQSTFDLKSDTVYAICPRDKFTDTEVYFYNQTPSGKYNVYSLESKCSTELLDDCTDKSYKPLLESYEPKTNDKGKYSFPITLSTATHGIFVYEDKEKGCGTYVESTVEDTLIPMEISMKRDVVASLISKCYDSSDAIAEFFIEGGTPDYKIVRNPEWGSREIMEIDGEPQIFTPELKTIEYKSKNSVGEDTVIEKRYVSIPGLMSGTHYLSVIDAIGCVRPFGGDVIDSVVVKKPAPLKVDFATSMVCPVTSITTGGNIFFNKVSGGTPPYSYSYSFDNGKVYDCNPIQEIPEGKLHKPVYMALTDANGCVKDTITEFVDDDFMVENVDFWASTKRYKGDVLALIDNCEPAEHLDSVVFTFTNPITGEVDSRIETLDKRMYIYDIESGAEKYKMALKGSKNTKTEVSDAYFKNHFNLLVDENLAKHISFIRMNDTTGAWTTSMNNQDSVWVMHNVKMTAYLKGCAYETEYRELKINYDNIEIYDGGLPRGGDILSMTVTPNPCVDFSLTKMKATFAKKMDADLYIYHMNGTSEAHYHISASDPNWTDATKYDDASFEISLDKVLTGSGSNMDGVYSEVMVVYLKTSRDAKSTHIIVDPKLLDK